MKQHFTHLPYVWSRGKKRTGGADCSCVYASFGVWCRNTLLLDNSIYYLLLYCIPRLCCAASASLCHCLSRYSQPIRVSEPLLLAFPCIDAQCQPLQQRRSCRLNEELKRLRQGRIAQEKTLAASQTDTKQAQAACQVLLPYVTFKIKPFCFVLAVCLSIMAMSVF